MDFLIDSGEDDEEINHRLMQKIQCNIQEAEQKNAGTVRLPRAVRRMHMEARGWQGKGQGLPETPTPKPQAEAVEQVPTLDAASIEPFQEEPQAQEPSPFGFDVDDEDQLSETSLKLLQAFEEAGSAMENFPWPAEEDEPPAEDE